MAYPSVRPALLWLCALGFLIVSGRHAQAAELYAGDGLDIRWDNTLRYSAALRVESPNATLLGYINGDDGGDAVQCEGQTAFLGRESVGQNRLRHGLQSPTASPLQRPK